MSALVAVLMGSKSDMDVMQSCMETLTKFEIEHEVHVMSAHRTPDKVREFVSSARDRGFEVIIAAAGGAAALPGVCKAYTPLPVIGVPLASSELKGIDALYSDRADAARHAGGDRRGRRLGRAQRRDAGGGDPGAQPRRHTRGVMMPIARGWRVSLPSARG